MLPVELAATLVNIVTGIPKPIFQLAVVITVFLTLSKLNLRRPLIGMNCFRV